MKPLKTTIEESLAVLLRGEGPRLGPEHFYPAALQDHAAGISHPSPLKQLKPESMDWTKR